METIEGTKMEVLHEERYDPNDDDDKDQYIEEEYLETQSELEFSKDLREDTEFIKMDPEPSTNVARKKDPKKTQMPPFVESVTVTNAESGEPEHRYQCNICEKAFRSAHQIRYHRFCDESIEKPYKCDECSAKYKTSYQLKQHQQLHLNTQYECPECGKKFAHDASAKKHLKTHFQTTAPPPKRPVPKGNYPCAVCEKVFTRNDYLKKHMICHDEKKRFKCDYCDRYYARNNALKFHIVTAHEERQEYKCECGKVMTSMQSLARHQIVHSTKKHFKCLPCGLRSSRKDNLFRHIRTFHTEVDPKTSIGIDEGSDTEDPLAEDEEVPEVTEDAKTVIRSQEKTLRKNVIVLKKSKETASKTEDQASSNETPTIVYVTNRKSNEEVETPAINKSTVQNMKNIDIYRKILMPIEEQEEVREYFKCLS